MSYLVLARKWRPQGFDDLVGQEPISRILSNAISQGRLAHAYLFSGPRGVGKTTTARILAKALNCEQGPTAVPCGACSFCKGITDGSSVDVMEIDGASNNSVNDIRDLRERVKYAPAGGRYKVYIIDEAHMLSDAAFNALLKTLEEPPPHVVFVMATTSPRKVPATVLSRCQHLPFRKIPLQKIAERLKMIVQSEGLGIAEPAIEMIARASEGSMRDSLTILDQVSAFSSDVKDTEIKDLLGIADFKALSDLAVLVIQGDRRGIVELIAELTDRGTDLKSFTRDLMNFIRDLLVVKIAGASGDVLDMNESECAVVTEIVRGVSEDHLTLLLSEMIKAETDVRMAASPRVGLEMALIKASFLSTLKPVKEAIEHLEGLSSPRSAPKAHRTTEEQSADENLPTLKEPLVEAEHPSPPVDEERRPREGEDFWQSVIRKVDAVNHPLASKLTEASARLEGDTVFLTYDGGSAIHAESVMKHLAAVEGYVTEVLGKQVAVKIDTVKKNVPRKRELKERVLSDPLVKEAIDLFDGRIVDVRSSETSDNGGTNVKEDAR